jgi:hypothetical protein
MRNLSVVFHSTGARSYDFLSWHTRGNAQGTPKVKRTYARGHSGIFLPSFHRKLYFLFVLCYLTEVAMAVSRKTVALISVLTLSAIMIVLAIWALPGKERQGDLEILLSQPGCIAVNQLGTAVVATGNCLIRASASRGAYFTLSNGIRVSQELVLAWRFVK